MEVERQDDVLVVRLDGELREGAAAKLVLDVGDLLVGEAPRVIIAMDNVSYVSSSGIGSLVRLFKEITDRGGALCVSGAATRVRDVFDVAGVRQLFECLDTVDEAIAWLRTSAASGSGGAA